jgi:SAM-dependent methyltransferase
VLDLLHGLMGRASHGRAAFEVIVELGARLAPALLPPWLDEVVLRAFEADRALSRSFEALAWRLVATRHRDGKELLGDPLALKVLARCLACSPDAERLVLSLRRLALELSSADRALPPETLEAVVALALQANRSNHVHAALPGEAEVVARLRAAIEGRLAAGESPTAQTLALYAVFAPLDRLEGIERPALPPGEQWPASLLPLLRRAIAEPLEERALCHHLPSLGAPEDATARAVAAQYEAHPYPRWIEFEAAPRRPLGTLLREHLPAADIPSALDGPCDLLIAGCGTGWWLGHAASTYAGARVIGLDLSRASLAYGLREVLARRLGNVALVHGDLMRVSQLGRRFDYIVAGGVLHHLADPITGWRALIEVLAPDGLMQIGLYSERGRRPVAEAQAVIKARRIGSSDEAIRGFRRAVLEAPADSPLSPLVRYADFYDLHGCRDLLFNVVEHRFDLPGLEATLEALDLEFLGFSLPAPEIAQRYAGRFPEDPLMRSLANWHALELEQPDLFASMYQFWCRRRAMGTAPP